MTSGATSSTTPRRTSTTLVLAAVVTLAVAIPLGVVAWQARGDDGPAPDNGLMITSGGSTEDLAGTVIPQGIDPTLSIAGDDLIAAAWAVYTSDGMQLAQGNAVGTPPFRVDLPVGTIGGWEEGIYDLLVTVTAEDGSTSERAARFAVEADR